VFVVDGSPDDSYLRLRAGLEHAPFRAQLLLLSRNFGAFSAIRAGLAAGTGDHFAVMAADLQEPPELVVEFARRLSTGRCDVVVGQRTGRADPLLSRVSSAAFWGLYRRFVQPEVPPGGVDVLFGCTRAVRDQIVRMTELNTSLVGLLFWVGFRREAVPYARRERHAGKSGWTWEKKLASS
jgi:glycosyltransferase involved in cell wall biosynthesis